MSDIGIFEEDKIMQPPMSDIDYEAEVKKVYPDAWCMSAFDDYCIRKDPKYKDQYFTFSIGRGKTELQAWKSAFESLKNKGGERVMEKVSK